MSLVILRGNIRLLKIFFDDFCYRRFLEKLAVESKFFDGQWIKLAFMA